MRIARGLSLRCNCYNPKMSAKMATLLFIQISKSTTLFSRPTRLKTPLDACSLAKSKKLHFQPASFDDEVRIRDKNHDTRDFYLEKCPKIFQRNRQKNFVKNCKKNRAGRNIKFKKQFNNHKKSWRHCPSSSLRTYKRHP